jgi:hypothetical protein
MALFTFPSQAVSISGGATEAKQDTIITGISDINTELDTQTTDLSTIAGDTTSLDAKIPAQGAALTAASTPVNIASDQTVPVSASSLPLPTGAATEATLSTIAGDTTSLDGKIVANIIDTNNSTSTPLGGGATFTGTGTDVSAYSAVTIQLYADVDSASDGMQFQFSTDNTNWDESNDFNMDISVSSARRFQFPVTAQYFRLVYTNGAGAQSSFRVQTILHNTNVLTSIHRIDTGLSNDRSVTVTKSVIAGQTTAGGGNFVNVKVDPSGALETTANQDTHDSLLCNANIQVGDVDVSGGNPVPVSASSLPLPTGAATEATLSAQATATKQDEQTAILKPDVIDQIDTTPLLDTSTTNIPGSAGSPVQVVASLAADTQKVLTVEDIGEFIGLYTGAAASEVLKCVLPLGGGEVQVDIPSGTRISLRAMGTTAISTGNIAINFIG